MKLWIKYENYHSRTKGYEKILNNNLKPGERKLRKTAGESSKARKKIMEKTEWLRMEESFHPSMLENLLGQSLKDPQNIRRPTKVEDRTLQTLNIRLSIMGGIGVPRFRFEVIKFCKVALS